MNEKNIGDFAALPREIIFEILDFITTAALQQYLKMIESKDYLSSFERYSIGLASKDMLNIIIEFISDRSFNGISFHKENISLYYEKNDVTPAEYNTNKIYKNKKFQSVAGSNINLSKDLFMSYDINKFYMRMFCGGITFKIIDDAFSCGLGDNLFKFSYGYINSEEIKGKISSFTIIAEIIGAKLMFLVEFHRDKISCFRFFAVKDKSILHYIQIYLFGANGNVLMDRFDVDNEETSIIEKDRINFIKLLPQNLKDKIALLAEKMNEELKNILIFHVDIRAESIHKFWKKMEEE